MEIKKTISEWAESNFPLGNSAFQADIQELPAAPPFLFTEPTGAGYCVTIKPAFSSSSPSTRNSLLATAAEPLLGFWIPESGSNGAYVTLRDGDEEILTFALDWFHATHTDSTTGERTSLANEDALLENLSALFAEFLRDEILLPSLEKHLDDNGIAHEPFSIGTVGGIEPWDEKNWSFVFLPAEPIISSEPHDQPDWSTSRVLGLTGNGRAAHFSYSRHEVEPSGYVDHINLESQSSGIDSPAAIQAWVEETLAVTAS